MPLISPRGGRSVPTLTILLSLLIATLGFPSSAHSTVHDDISGPDIRLQFDAGNLVQGLKARRLDRCHDDGFAYDFADEDIWQLRFIEIGQQPGSSPFIDVKPSNSDVISDIDVSKKFNKVTVTWDITDSPVGAFEVKVIAKIGFFFDPVLELDIEVDTPPGFAFATYEVQFPRLRIESPNAPGDSTASERFVIPIVGGHELEEPTISLPPGPNGAQLIHPGTLSMQWFGYYDQEKDPFLFLGTRDSTGYRKQFHLFRQSSTESAGIVGFEVRVKPENNLTASDYSSPAPAVLACIEGDWFDGAKFYRRWAVFQPWAFGPGKGPMRYNSEFSDLVKDMQMVGWFSLDSRNPFIGQPPCPTPLIPIVNQQFQSWLPNLEDEEDWFGLETGEILSLIYNWHPNRFDSNFGEWFPAVPNFLNAATDVSMSGRAFAPYFQPDLYSVFNATSGCQIVAVPGFGGDCAEDFRLLDANGTPSLSTDCLGQATQGTFLLDYASTFAQQQGLWVVEQLQSELAAVGGDAGLRGMYYDTLTHLNSELCYNGDPGHQGHPLGGGTFYNDGKLALCDLVKSAFRSPSGNDDSEFFLFSEAEDEHFLGRVEIMNVNASIEDTSRPQDRRNLLPLFQTVYHDYLIATRFAALQFPDWQLLFSPNAVIIEFRRAYAAQLFFGHTPWAGGLMSFTSLAQNLADPRYFRAAEMIQSYMSILKHDDVRDYVRFGSRERDPEVTGIQHVNAAASRMLVPYEKTQPSVYVSAWRNTGTLFGNDVGVLLTNWVEDLELLDVDGNIVAGDQTVTFTLDRKKHRLWPGLYLVNEIEADGNEIPIDMVTFNDEYTLTRAVPARTAKFITFSRFPF